MHYQITNNTIIYDFQKSLEFITPKGKAIHGWNQFLFYQEDMPIIRKLFAYTISADENTIIQGLDPRKGLILCDPIGCGKTSMMRLMQLLLKLQQRFTVKA